MGRLGVMHDRDSTITELNSLHVAFNIRKAYQELIAIKNGTECFQT